MLSLKNNPIPISDVKKHLGIFVLKYLRLLEKHINIIKQFALMWLNFELNKKLSEAQLGSLGGQRATSVSVIFPNQS